MELRSSRLLTCCLVLKTVREHVKSDSPPAELSPVCRIQSCFWRSEVLRHHEPDEKAGFFRRWGAHFQGADKKRTWSQAGSGRRDAASHPRMSLVLEQGCFWKLAGEANQCNGGVAAKTSCKEVSPFGVGLPQPLWLGDSASFILHCLSYNYTLTGGGGLNSPRQWAYSEHYMNFRPGGAIHPRLGRSWKKRRTMLSCPHRGVGRPRCPWAGETETAELWILFTSQSEFAHPTVVNSCRFPRKILSGGRTGPDERWWRLWGTSHVIRFTFAEQAGGG